VSWSKRAMSVSKISDPELWNDGTSAMTDSSRSMRASSWSGSPATARPDPTRTGPDSVVWRKLSGDSATSRVIPTGLPPEWESASAIRWPEPLEPIGALTALYHRDTQKGVTGQVVDIGIYEAVFKMMESRIPDYKHLGLVRERTGSVLPGVSPSNICPTRDEKYVVIAANADAVFARLTRAMGQPELSVDPRFATHEARGDQMEELDGIISDWSRSHDSKELLDLLSESGVPAGPIYSAAEIIDDPQYWAREMLLNFSDPALGEMVIPGIVPKLSETPGRVNWLGPDLGEHNREIYQNLLGFDDQECGS
jgi:crotonobetainyl-CoA:carnitine CoA-transferase CaiB-like acyl-CoA transferase